VTAWTVRFDVPVPAGAIRVAVKDAIDMAGVPTVAGCRAVQAYAVPATEDAACLAGIRAAANTVIVGKTTQTELCLSPTGINEAFGTPVNPLAPDRIPGGSSSGSAVAVAAGEADVALGTDTGGSVRIPAACCGIVGLKTTWGRVSAQGVWPLAPSLDTVGPLARDVAGVTAGMRLLEPGFTVAPQPARVVGRVRIEGVEGPIQDAIDAAIEAADLTVRDVDLPGWFASFDAFDPIIGGEFWRCQGALLGADGLGRNVILALEHDRQTTPAQIAAGVSAQRRWQAEMAAAFDGVQLLALPTLIGLPPKLTEVKGFPATVLTAPINVAGVPALAMPVRAAGLPVPASLQLVGPAGAEELLCATGLLIEGALR
jgi:amidase